MKTHAFTAILLLAFGLLIPLNASAKKGGGFKIKAIERAAGELGIDDETLSRIKSIMYEGRRGGVDLRAQLEKARIDLHERMDQADPDRAQVMAAIERLGKLQIKMKQHRAGIMLSVRALLTPEQRRGLKAFMEKKRRNRKGNKRRQKRSHRGGPGGF